MLWIYSWKIWLIFVWKTVTALYAHYLDEVTLFYVSFLHTKYRQSVTIFHVKCIVIRQIYLHVYLFLRYLFHTSRMFSVWFEETIKIYLKIKRKPSNTTEFDLIWMNLVLTTVCANKQYLWSRLFYTWKKKYSIDKHNLLWLIYIDRAASNECYCLSLNFRSSGWNFTRRNAVVVALICLHFFPCSTHTFSLWPRIDLGAPYPFISITAFGIMSLRIAIKPTFTFETEARTDNVNKQSQYRQWKITYIFVECFNVIEV